MLYEFNIVKHTYRTNFIENKYDYNDNSSEKKKATLHDLTYPD